MTELTATPEGAPVSEGASDDDRLNAILGKMEETPVTEETTAPEPEAEAGDEPVKSEDTEPEAEPQEPLHTVKINGREVQVTLDELRKGYSRNEDYKEKTAKLSEERRSLEADQAKRAEYIQRLDTVVNTAAQFDPILTEAAKIDWAKLAEEDPAEYVAKKARVDARKEQLTEAINVRHQLAQEQFEAAQKACLQTLASEIPEFADDEKRPLIIKELDAYLIKERGFTSEELQGVTDPRMILMAHEALQFRKQKALKASMEAKKVAAEPGKTVRPGSTATEAGDAKFKALKAKAKRSGSIDDAAEAILSRLSS